MGKLKIKHLLPTSTSNPMRVMGEHRSAVRCITIIHRTRLPHAIFGWIMRTGDRNLAIAISNKLSSATNYLFKEIHVSVYERLKPLPMVRLWAGFRDEWRLV